jgi:hypothetical protein
MIVLLSLLDGNLYMSLKKQGKWLNYTYAERAFIVLGVLLPSVLAWQIFFGAL